MEYNTCFYKVNTCFYKVKTCKKSEFSKIILKTAGLQMRFRFEMKEKCMENDVPAHKLSYERQAFDSCRNGDCDHESKIFELEFGDFDVTKFYAI